MRRFRRQVVGRRPVVQVRVGDEAEGVEQLKRAVDRRDVDALGGLLHAGRDLFWRRVVEPGHRFKYELTLRGNPVAAGPQLLVPAAVSLRPLLHGSESSSAGRVCHRVYRVAQAALGTHPRQSMRGE